MILPLLISVPHGGRQIPYEVKKYCLLTSEDVEYDRDGGVSRIFDLQTEVMAYVGSDMARTIIDLNRAPDDFRPNGVIKSHTSRNMQVFSRFPSAELQTDILTKYYYPYHRRLTELASSGVILGVDCHTMAEYGPPAGPDEGMLRPMVCLGNGDGTCPQPWFDLMVNCFREQFCDDVKINNPYRGGYIISHHSRELPWLQLEISRSDTLSDNKKKAMVLAALRNWCRLVDKNI